MGSRTLAKSFAHSADAEHHLACVLTGLQRAERHLPLTHHVEAAQRQRVRTAEEYTLPKHTETAAHPPRLQRHLNVDRNHVVVHESRRRPVALKAPRAHLADLSEVAALCQHCECGADKVIRQAIERHVHPLPAHLLRGASRERASLARARHAPHGKLTEVPMLRRAPCGPQHASAQPVQVLDAHEPNAAGCSV